MWGLNSEASSIFTLDAITLFPGEEKILDMRATATGRTVLMCQVRTPFLSLSFCVCAHATHDTRWDSHASTPVQVAQNVRAGMIMAYTIVP
jgi:hypothetical protein